LENPKKFALLPTARVAFKVMSEQLSPETLIPGLEAEWQRQGDVFTIAMNGMQRVMVAHPVDIHNVLTGRNYTDKASLYGGVPIFGDNILDSSGDEWRRSRRPVAPAFHHEAVGNMTSRIAAVGAEFVNELRMRDGEVIDVREEMTRLSLTTILSILFGGNVDADDLTYRTLNDTLEFATVPQDRVDEAETQSRFKDHFAKLNGIAQGIIDSTRAAGPDHGSLDLPNLLVHSLDEETGRPLDDERIRSELLAFVFAGYETTSLTLTWFHKLLEDRGDITEKIRVEVDAILGNRAPGLEDLPKLTYTRQVVDEVLRYRPTVPFIVRSARDDAELGGVPIESGDVVAPYIWGAHRHPDFWKNPEVFDPDRFSAENSAGRDRRAYLPFGRGNRLCIGNEVALTELTVFAAQLAQGTTIEVEPNDVQPAAYVTIRPNGPIRATVHSRL
jgi:cytochrome P450